jgi:DNA ligase (NAD+)
MTDLENQILYYQKKYYDGEPEISDAEFDNLWDQLRSEQPDSTVLRSIGADTSLFPKANHIMFLGSQQKAKDESEFIKWSKKQNTKSFLVQLKLDGASLELQYKNGQFLKAVTRGDGTVGDDITVNVKKMKGVPMNVEPSFTGAIRAEVLMFKSDKNKYFPEMANCRNGAVGTMKQKDGKGCEHLNVISYDVFGFDNKNELQKIRWLEDNGFNSVIIYHCNTVNEIIDYRNKISSARDNLDYDIDGIVVKCIEFDPEDLKRDRPDKQIAFKFSLEFANTELLNVEFRQSGKRFTPVAHINPVQLCGTTVKQASLHNMDILNNFISQGMMIGSIIRIVKAGEIIPYVEKVV